MGWLTGPKPPKQEIAHKRVQILDGTQNHISVPSGLATGGPNTDAMIEPNSTYGNYANSGYGRNELVYACIRYRAESLPQSVIRIYRSRGTPGGDPELYRGPPVDDHPLRELFENPNPVTNEFEFFELSSTYKDLAGTCFWLVVSARNGQPAQLWPLRPDLVGVLPYGGPPTPVNPTPFTWVYRPDPERPELWVPIPDAGDPRARTSPAYIIRIRYPNPNATDPGWRYYGQPPLRAAARATTLDNAATDFVDTMLRNHAMPAVVVETESTITAELHARLKAMWNKAFGGIERGTPAFLQKGMRVHALGLNLTDLEFPDLRAVAETRVCMSFGVEPILVGAKIGLEHNAYKDYREARLSFWEEAMASAQRRFIEPVRKHLLPLYQGVGRRAVQAHWDNSGVLALREAEKDKWQRASDALAKGGITRNHFLRIVGLPEVPGGDVFLTPSGVLVSPADQSVEQAVLAARPIAPERVEEKNPSEVDKAMDIGLLAAEFGINLTNDELARLHAIGGEIDG